LIWKDTDCLQGYFYDMCRVIILRQLELWSILMRIFSASLELILQVV